MAIGGNIQALLQVKKSTKNNIGECISTWVDCISVWGWLDLSSGDSKHTTFYSKIQESTHIFLCDYLNLKGLPTGEEENETVDITNNNARMVVNGDVYEILLIDNPMNMNEHLEIYLRFIGGQ